MPKFKLEYPVKGLEGNPQAGDLVDLEEEVAHPLVLAGALSRHARDEVSLDDFTKADLLVYAQEKFSVTLDGRLGKTKLLQQVKDLAGPPAQEPEPSEPEDLLTDPEEAPTAEAGAESEAAESTEE
jgi:hypothetical protein